MIIAHQLCRPSRHLLKRPALPRPVILEVEHVTDLIARLQQIIHILLRVRCAHAEPHPARRETRRRVSDNNDCDGGRPCEHEPAEFGHLANVEQQKRDDRRVIVAIDEETKPTQTPREVAGVEGEPAETCGTLGAVTQGRGQAEPLWQELEWCGSKVLVRVVEREVRDDIFAGGGSGWCGARGRAVDECRSMTFDTHDASHACHNLGEDGRAHGFRVRASMRAEAQTVDEYLVTRDVATGSTERFGERAHKEVDGVRRKVEVVADTAAVGPECTDGVGLVDE